MEKNVVVSIVGMHRVGDEEGQPQEIEVVSPGQYYEKGGKTYLTYSEFLDPNDPALETRATVKLEDGKVTLSRMGSIGTQMTFIQGQRSRVYYNTPFGMMEMGITTRRVKIQRDEHRLQICIDYALEVNNQFNGANKITIHVADHTQKVNLA